MTRFETSILATPETISALTDKVMTYLEEQGVEGRTTHHVGLVLDEVLTNLATHGNCSDRPAKIAVSVEPDKVVGEVIDTGPPFDPRLAPDPSLDIAAADRPVGGLGLYLVRKLSSALEYTRRNNENCTTFAIARGE
jgi:anti-sigma regulatory factor (Ser/Thr protein kinase)